MYPGPTGSALFVADGEGKLMNLMSGALTSSIKLQPSSILKPCPIVDYIYYESTLFVLREDGLLFSWDSAANCYKKMIQTEYRYHTKKIDEFNQKNIIFANQGLLLLNCCEITNKLLILTTDFELIGRVPVKSDDFGLHTSLLKES